jgi:hypothetical protein
MKRQPEAFGDPCRIALDNDHEISVVSGFAVACGEVHFVVFCDADE